ncbi:hypothetical protein NMY22_g17686 [Coprinellus aureogranulatus]|nr:hypothetical protein NMY22_g17686 [Coprinellus aureogranulatus]
MPQWHWITAAFLTPPSGRVPMQTSLISGVTRIANPLSSESFDQIETHGELLGLKSLVTIPRGGASWTSGLGNGFGLHRGAASAGGIVPRCRNSIDESIPDPEVPSVIVSDDELDRAKCFLAYHPSSHSNTPLPSKRHATNVVIVTFLPYTMLLSSAGCQTLSSLPPPAPASSFGIKMTTRDCEQAAHQGETIEQREHQGQGASSSPHVLNNFFAPVNIGQAKNCNFGINHGSITSNEHRVTSSRSPDGTPFREDRKREASAIRVHRLPNGEIDLFGMLNPITDASHTRNLDLSPPHSQCFKGTRKRVLKKICSWVNSSMLLGKPHILWVYGYAGCGKSAIALAIAKHFAGEKRLAASFFFFRGTNRSSVARFATTVAHQVTASVPAAVPFIEAALGTNPALVTKDTPVDVQFESLVYGPINSIKWDRFAAFLRRGPYLIVLDGVDECEDREVVANFIEHMIQYFEKKPFIPLRILITSRVEDHLHRRLHSSKQVQLLDLINHTSDADIFTALDVAISNEKRGLVLKCADSWPSQEDKAKLVKHIGGSYIFMTTIVKLLFDPNIQDGQTPMERLPLVLSTHPNFDGLYKSILKPCQGLPHFHDIISTIVLAQEPLSISQIGSILDINAAGVANVLINLNAIMQIPGDDRTPVILWHTSLRDFFTCEERSGPYFASPFYHRRLAYLKPASPTLPYWERYAFHHLEKLLVSMGRDFGPGKCDRELMIDLLNSPMFLDGCTALEAASRAGKWDIVRKLVNVKADVNVHFKGSRSNIVTALHEACYVSKVDMIYFLLENNANPNISDLGADFHYGMPLAFASCEGDIKLVSHLLKCGADPNFQGGFYGTALQAACTQDELEVVKLLLKHGADPDLTGGYYGSALHACANNGRLECVRILLEHQADPSVRDGDGGTPLHDACGRGHIKVAELLLDFGVDPTIRNITSETALQRAMSWMGGDSDVVQMLRDRGLLELQGGLSLIDEGRGKRTSTLGVMVIRFTKRFKRDPRGALRFITKTPSWRIHLIAVLVATS